MGSIAFERPKRAVWTKMFQSKLYSMKNNIASAVETAFRKPNLSGFVNSIFCTLFVFGRCSIRSKFFENALVIVIGW